jgi:hypothetical protein
MKTKRAALAKYWAGISLLMTAGLVAANFSDWSAPVSIGPTINSSAAEQ